MKILSRHNLVLLAVLTFALQYKAAGQTLLLDSLHGTWTMKEQYNNKARVEPKGTVEFAEDGTFKSNGSYFGSTVGSYTTDETKATIHIVIDGSTSEWSASIKNKVLRMTRVAKKKTPRIDLILMSEKAEPNSGT